MKTHFDSRSAARRKGRELLKLFPKGWKIRVWENLGWHLAFTFTNYVSVYFSSEYKRPYFSCLLGAEHGGYPPWTTDHYHSSDPMKCVKKCLRLARNAMVERLRIYLICCRSLKGQSRR